MAKTFPVKNIVEQITKVLMPLICTYLTRHQADATMRRFWARVNVLQAPSIIKRS